MESKLCLNINDIRVTYKSDKIIDDNIKNRKLFAQVLFYDKVLGKTDDCLPESSSEDSGFSWRLGSIRSLPLACTSFTLVIPTPEDPIFTITLRSNSLADNSIYAFDIECKEVHNGCFECSFEVHNIENGFRESAIVSQIHSESEDDDDSPLELAFSPGVPLSQNDKQQFLSVLLQRFSSATSGSSEDFTVMGKLLISLYLSLEDTDYLELAILCMEHALRDATKDRCFFPHSLFCRLLFLRCTLPGSEWVVDKAFDSLRVEGLSDVLADEEDFLDLLDLVIKVLESLEQPRFAIVVLETFSGPLQPLAKTIAEDSENRLMISKLVHIAITLAQKSKETLVIMDIALPSLAISLPPRDYAHFLIRRAEYHTTRFLEVGDLDLSVVFNTLEEARDHDSVMNFQDKKDLCDIYLTLASKRLEDCAWDHSHRLLSFVVWGLSITDTGGAHHQHILTLKSTVISINFGQHIAWSQASPRGPQSRSSEDPASAIKALNANLSTPATLTEEDIDFFRRQSKHQLAGIVEEAHNYTGERHPKGAVQMTEIILKDTVHVAHVGSIRASNLLRASILACLASRTLKLPEAEQAYSSAMECLREWVSMIVSIQGRFRLAFECMALIGSDAISYAIEINRLDLALEWAEQTHSFVWSQMLQLRYPDPRLEAANPALAKELTEISSQLNDSQIEDVQIYSPADMAVPEVQNHLENVSRWAELVEEARNLPGLENFLKPKTSTEILPLAEALGGPIVYFNPNRYSCDALAIVPGRDEVVHIPLPDIDCASVKAIRFAFLEAFRGHARDVEVEEDETSAEMERVGKKVQPPKVSDGPNPLSRLGMSIKQVLRFLWHRVVKPVLVALGLKPQDPSSSDKLPRIWWCPSGPLSSLPIHAAGAYTGEVGSEISHYVVSSYIPSASTAFYATRPQQESHFKLLTVANPTGCGLPGTQVELQIIKKHIGTQHEIVPLTGKDATIEAVQREMRTATWAHFACHGVQSSGAPTESALILANKTRLNLLEIVKTSLPHAEFAFLSACQTATGDNDIPNEFAHLSSGMLVAGYRSVIGTMWRISDMWAPFVADRVYQTLLRDERPDFKPAAYALHDAVQALRKEHEVDFGVWVPFVHFGV